MPQVKSYQGVLAQLGGYVETRTARTITSWKLRFFSQSFHGSRLLSNVQHCEQQLSKDNYSFPRSALDDRIVDVRRHASMIETAAPPSARCPDSPRGSLAYYERKRLRLQARLDSWLRRHETRGPIPERDFFFSDESVSSSDASSSAASSSAVG